MASLGGYGAVDGSSSLGDGGGGRDGIGTGYPIHTAGSAETVDVWMGNNTGTFKFKVWRINGANYEFVAEDISTAMSNLNQVNTITLTTPIDVEVGDLVSFHVSVGQLEVDGTGPGVVDYIFGDFNTDQPIASYSELGAFAICAEVFGTPTVVGDTITLTDLADNSIIQRTVSTSNASVTISGTYSGTPTTIEARVVTDGTDTEIVTWTVIDATPSGDVFSGSLTVPEGGWYNVDVRYSNDTGVVSNGSNAWAVGMLIGVMGQSNARDYFLIGTDETPSANVVKYNETGWTLMTSTGNGANNLGNILEAATGVPVGLLDYGVSAAGLVLGVGTVDWTSAVVGYPYPLFEIGFNAVGGKLEAIVWVQGEQDSFEGITEATYEAALTTFVAKCRADIANGSDLASLPFTLSLLGRTTNGTTAEDQQNVRNAQEDVSDSTPQMAHVTAIDLPLRDTVHYTAAGYTTHAERHAQIILFALGLATYFTGPHVTSSLVVSDTIIDVNMTHNGGTDFTPASAITGFEVTEDDWSTTETISTAVRQDADTIRLTLAAPTTGTVKARYMYGNNPPITGVVLDNSTIILPLEGIREFIPSPAFVADVVLNWTDNSGSNNDQEDGFNIYRVESALLPGDWGLVYDTVAADLTTFTDTAVTEGTWWYRVTAFNGVGESSPDVSNIDSVVIAE